MDGVTTLIGLNCFDGVFAEGNPIFNTPEKMIIAKVIAVVFISLMLERFGKDKMFWIVPILAWFPVVWNTSMMITYAILF